MPNAQPEQADGREGARLSTSGTDTRTTATPEEPTLQEFLTRLVGNPEARSAFEADPRGALESAGLGELNATQVLQASSLVLDYAPAELVTEYGRTVQPGIDTFAASTQHVAINQLDPAQVPEPQEATDTNMSLLDNDNSANPNYSSGGDADKEMEQNIDIDNQDSQNLVSVHDVASGNEVAGNAVGAVGNTVGAVGNTVGGVNNTVDNTVDTVGGTANGAVGEVTDTVDGTVDTGVDVAVGAADTAVGTAGDLPVDDVTSTVEGVAGGVTGDVASEDAAGTLDGATGAVGGTVGQAEDVVGGVTSDLPLDLL
ncbi:IniB N-terminal domain-containing protein [Actinopolyspora sp. H202]|uniref:IniB N-terminal domain-containing protein n=1 Tax=Actinopolyspora sp. H202 TaxID=1500456 RepID=UPI003EE6AB08